MRGARHQPGQWHIHSTLNYVAASQPDCGHRAGGNFLRGGDWHVSAQLPLAEKRHGHQRRDLFGIYDATHGGFR